MQEIIKCKKEPNQIIRARQLMELLKIMVQAKEKGYQMLQVEMNESNQKLQLDYRQIVREFQQVNQ